MKNRILALCCMALLVVGMLLMAASCGGDPSPEPENPFDGEGIEGPIIDVE